MINESRGIRWYSGHCWIHRVVAFRRPVVWHCDESRVGPIPGSAKMTIWTNASPTKKFIDRRYIQQIGKNSVDSIVSSKEV